MAVLTSTGITFSDSTSQSTAATAAALVTTANVLSATAGATAGAVGTYAFLGGTGGTVAFTAGTTYAGSGLAYGGFARNNGAFNGGGTFATFSAGAGAVVSGTWRAMGSNNLPAGCETPRNATVFLRIS
jgi:hypothetical protein